MKAMTILQFITCVSVCLGSVAAEPTNTPVRVTISQFSRPPQDRIIVTSTNMIARVVKLFPGYEGQPADKFSSGQWPVEFTVEIAFADGHSRAIYVANNRWTAGAEHYTPMAQNWEELLQAMTSDFFKRTWSNMERLGQPHEPTTLIIGPCDVSGGRGGMKGQPDGAANGSQPSRSETNRTSSAAEILIPPPLNAMISKIHPGMSIHEVESVLSTSYPKVAGHMGDWSGQTGYIDYKLDDRFTLSVSSMTRDGKEVVHDEILMYLFDWSTKRRVDIKIYDWDKQPPKAPLQK